MTYLGLAFPAISLNVVGTYQNCLNKTNTTITVMKCEGLNGGKTMIRMLGVTWSSLLVKQTSKSLISLM